MCDTLNVTALLLSIATVLILLAAAGALINAVLTVRILRLFERIAIH